MKVTVRGIVQRCILMEFLSIFLPSHRKRSKIAAIWNWLTAQRSRIDASAYGFFVVFFYFFFFWFGKMFLVFELKKKPKTRKKEAHFASLLHNRVCRSGDRQSWPKIINIARFYCACYIPIWVVWAAFYLGSKHHIFSHWNGNYVVTFTLS